jgi:hypothetical protein
VRQGNPCPPSLSASPPPPLTTSCANPDAGERGACLKKPTYGLRAARRPCSASAAMSPRPASAFPQARAQVTRNPNRHGATVVSRTVAAWEPIARCKAFAVQPAVEPA